MVVLEWIHNFASEGLKNGIDVQCIILDAKSFHKLVDEMLIQYNGFDNLKVAGPNGYIEVSKGVWS